jgi:hypothetical protein
MIDASHIHLIVLNDVIHLNIDWSMYGNGNNDFFEPRRLCNSQLEYYMQVLLF